MRHAGKMQVSYSFMLFQNRSTSIGYPHSLNWNMQKCRRLLDFSGRRTSESSPGPQCLRSKSLHSFEDLICRGKSSSLGTL